MSRVPTRLAPWPRRLSARSGWFLHRLPSAGPAACAPPARVPAPHGAGAPLAFASASTRRFGASAAVLAPPSGESSRITVLGQEFPRDDFTNISPVLAQRLKDVPLAMQNKRSPLRLIRRAIERSLERMTPLPTPPPVVTTQLNFDDLGFPEDHPGRSPTDTYYVNRKICLRTHTSAHEVSSFAEGYDSWLLTADVYRRDEIDSSHYPIFHQMEGAHVFSIPNGDFTSGGLVERQCEEMESRLAGANIVIEDEVDPALSDGWQPGMDKEHAELALRHLKGTLNNLALALFGPRHQADVEASGKGVEAEPLRVRWIAATFPFTAPSFEIEVLFRGEWLEILGTGVVKQKTLDTAKQPGKLGWAFGLGLERIAMVLYGIPDIRLFWSQDERFLSQFAAAADALDQADTVHEFDEADLAKRTLVTYKPYSKFPPVLKDFSFWLGSPNAADTTNSTKVFQENDLYELIRDRAGDLVETVQLVDEFTHPKKNRTSRCYRITYRHMDSNLTHEAVNELHQQVVQDVAQRLNIEPR